jgi:hypothetical protein
MNASIVTPDSTSRPAKRVFTNHIQAAREKREARDKWERTHWARVPTDNEPDTHRLRVPGGWLYRTVTAMTFAPYSVK